MRLLSFDTSSYALHLCLMEDGTVVYDHVNTDTAANRQDISRLLLPEIDKGIQSVGWKKASINCLVVGQGPGSFTGIRSSVVTARTVCQALELPCLAISLFDCYASLVGKPAAIVLKAGPEQVFMAICADKNNNGSSLSQEPLFLPLSELAGQLPKTINHYIEAGLKESAAAHGLTLPVLPEITNIAIIQAQIASDFISLQVPDLNPILLKEKFPWSQVEPLYIRNPSVTVSKTNGNPH